MRIYERYCIPNIEIYIIVYLTLELVYNYILYGKLDIEYFIWKNKLNHLFYLFVSFRNN
jgi:hypothetical protein